MVMYVKEKRTKPNFCIKIHRVRFECHPNDADRSVLKDETNHTVDDPQNIANSICSASQRATKSVGIATPTYYANLVATRAKKWDISDENGSTVFTTNSGTQTSGERHCEFDYFKSKINKMNEKV
ncbi:hypothetical protein PPACK8108_LOCUS10331 [Phakopsora pachyrhizi]|uniref:Piwi domain-containing protein n=1 Tax=Phakopsora pachyrhizi TaxID=170000 RepID=A0AAV0AZW9_PHAPC|nr:hypothetical protein PPACK8108_LOCUS10331 [Phakopsora pachyrhizi]